LRNAYFVTAQSVVKDAAGNIVEVHCTYDPASRGGNSPDGRKVKSTMHWVSAAHAISAEIRLYDKLFTKPDPADVEEGQDVLDNLNPTSLEIVTGAKLEPSLASAEVEQHFQFERVGYFCLDPDSKEGALVFNRTLALKDSWTKIEKKPLHGADAR
jgi:glutaminyl-tRNA synthetase